MKLVLVSLLAGLSFQARVSHRNRVPSYHGSSFSVPHSSHGSSSSIPFVSHGQSYSASQPPISHGSSYSAPPSIPVVSYSQPVQQQYRSVPGPGVVCKNVTERKCNPKLKLERVPDKRLE